MNDVTIAANSGYGVSTEPSLAGTSWVNTVIAGNGLGSCDPGNGVAGGIYSLSSDNSCPNPATSPAAAGLIIADPLLGPLADNGGPTLTHALLSGSPAIDAAHPDGCPSVDQRGAPRPVDGNGDGVAACDIGSYEAGTAAPPETARPTTPSALPDTGGAPLRPADSDALPVYQQVLATLVVAIVYTSPGLVQAATPRTH